MRRLHPGEGAQKPEARYHPEDAAVDATGIWHEGHATDPGRSVVLPPATGVLPASQGVGMGRQKSAEAVVVGSTKPAKGRTSSTGGGRSVDGGNRCRR